MLIWYSTTYKMQAMLTKLKPKTFGFIFSNHKSLITNKQLQVASSSIRMRTRIYFSSFWYNLCIVPIQCKNLATKLNQNSFSCRHVTARGTEGQFPYQKFAWFCTPTELLTWRFEIIKKFFTSQIDGTGTFSPPGYLLRLRACFYA